MMDASSNFFQLMEVIYQKERCRTFTKLNDKILKITPRAAMNFPARDVYQLKEHINGYQLECQFMGLYGVDSPLPSFFNEWCLKENNTGKSLRDFLDIINHRNYVLHFFAWRAFQPEAGFYDQESYFTFINSLTAFQENTSTFSWPSFIANNNFYGLEAALKKLVLEIPFSVRGDIPAWEQINSSGLGNGIILADNALLGNRVYARGYHLEIQIGPLEATMAPFFLPGAKKTHMIKIFLDAILPVSMRYKIKMILKPKEENTGLGLPCFSLGSQTWLGQNNRYCTVSHPEDRN